MGEGMKLMVKNRIFILPPRISQQKRGIIKRCFKRQYLSNLKGNYIMEKSEQSPPESYGQIKILCHLIEWHFY